MYRHSDRSNLFKLVAHSNYFFSNIHNINVFISSYFLTRHYPSKTIVVYKVYFGRQTFIRIVKIIVLCYKYSLNNHWMIKILLSYQ